MHQIILLMAIGCGITPCTIAAAQTRCIVIEGTADALRKDNAVEQSLEFLAQCYRQVEDRQQRDRAGE